MQSRFVPRLVVTVLVRLPKRNKSKGSGFGGSYKRQPLAVTTACRTNAAPVRVADFGGTADQVSDSYFGSASLAFESAPKGRRYEFVEKNNSEFVQLMQSVRSRKGRRNTGKLLVEGKRLIADAILAGLQLDCLIFTDPVILNDLPLMEDEGRLLRVSQERMKTWSDMVTPPGVMAVMKAPSYEKLLEKPRPLPVVAVCENIREPGNLGAVLRILAAVGCEKALLLKGSCDLWEPKVLRGGMGAHFRLPVYQDLNWQLIPSYLPQRFSVFLADSDSVPSFSEGVLHAGANLPIVQYSDPQYCNATLPIVLIVTGETHPCSLEAFKFAADNGGGRIHIPMRGGLESLNAASALAVVVFEIQRQFIASSTT